MQKAVPLLYWLACLGLVPAGVMLFFPQHYLANIVLYVVSTFLLVPPALLDLFLLLRKGSRAEGESRQLLPSSSDLQSQQQLQQRPYEFHQLLTKLTYVMGGLCFLAGAVLYLPTLPCELCAVNGTWTFRFGSVFYFIGTATSLQHLRVLVFGHLSFMVGSCLYVAGGIVSQVGASADAVAALWSAGGVAFALGASHFLFGG